MKRIIQPSLLFAGLFPTLFSGGMSAKAQSLSDQMKVRRPNILWISTEDLSPHLGCYGDEIAQTPNLDRLAEQGMRFTRVFYDGSYQCTLSCGNHNGMYQTSIGCMHMYHQLPLFSGKSAIYGCSASLCQGFYRVFAYSRLLLHQQQQDRLSVCQGSRSRKHLG